MKQHPDKYLQGKLEKLIENLNQYTSITIAFSGGVDSTLLLKVAREVLGDKVLAIYVDSPLQPARERAAINQLAESIGSDLHILTMDDLDHEAFRNNPPDRCYYCKAYIFDQIIEISHLRGIMHIADGSNADDSLDYRPGAKALAERSVVSPLKKAGLTKQEVRDLSYYYGLPTWEKDALACLATRIPYGEPITIDKLSKVDKLEELLHNKGYRNVRVRYHFIRVSVEVRSDQVDHFRNSADLKLFSEEASKLGFRKVDIQESGYKQGRMNEALDQKSSAK